jgi:hypothetical protein
MFETSNKEHNRITKAAVAELQAKYPRLRIYEQVSFDSGWYFILICFPSHPRTEIQIFNGASEEAIVAEAVNRIQSLFDQATQDLKGFLADVDPSTCTYVRVDPPTPEEFVRAWQRADFIEDVAEGLHQSSHTLWIRAIRYRKTHGVPLKHLKSRNHGTNGSGFRDAVDWDALAKIAKDALKP